MRCARVRPDQVLYAFSRAGSFSHLAVALLTSMTDTRMRHVAYKGGGPAINELDSGETQFLAESPPAVVPHLASKRLRLLAVTSDTRLPQFSDTRTVAESGVAGYEFRACVALFRRAGLAKPVVHDARAAAARMKSDYDKYDKLIRLTGAKPD